MPVPHTPTVFVVFESTGGIPNANNAGYEINDEAPTAYPTNPAPIPATRTSSNVVMDTPAIMTFLSSAAHMRPSVLHTTRAKSIGLALLVQKVFRTWFIAWRSGIRSNMRQAESAPTARQDQAGPRPNHSSMWLRCCCRNRMRTPPRRWRQSAQYDRQVGR